MRIAIALCLALICPPLIAQSVTDKVVSLTQALEQEPLSATATDSREWLIEWIANTPDYSVTICDTFGPIMRKQVIYGPELMVQSMFGNVMYQIKNPGTKDEPVLQQAGMESVLKAYQSFLAKDPKARIQYFDELLDNQRQGTLKETLAPIIAKKCKG